MIDFIQLSNLSYLTLGLYMLKKRHVHSDLVIIVFFVSALHHYFPKEKILQRLDGTIANIILAIILPYYLINKQKTFHYFASILTFIVALIFYIKSGNDFNSKSYIMYHSLWHIISPLALYILLHAPNYDFNTDLFNNENNLNKNNKSLICIL